MVALCETFFHHSLNFFISKLQWKERLSLNNNFSSFLSHRVMWNIV